MTQINVNTATFGALNAVPSVGEIISEINRCREDHRASTALRRLEEVPGIAGTADGLDDALTI